MSLTDLPPQPPLNPMADAYGAECLKRTAEVIKAHRTALDLPYGSDYWQKIDIYLPPDRSLRDLPVMLFFHGGGWTHGYKEWCGFMAPALFELPAILVSVSYRLHPAAPFPAPVKDGFAALRFVHDNIAKHGGSPARLFIGGHSAGAHIAAVMALRSDWLAEAGLPADTIKGAFCISGSYSRRGVTGTPAAGYGMPPGPLQLEEGTPLTLLANAKVPFHITWGGTERQLERVERSSMQLIGGLRDHGARADWLFLPEADHFQTHLETGRPGNAWTRAFGAAITAT